MSPDIAEMVDLYAADRPGMSRHVIAAFIEEGIEPPMDDRMGFDAKQSEIIAKYYEKHDPYGSRAQAKKLKDRLDEADAGK